MKTDPFTGARLPDQRPERAPLAEAIRMAGLPEREPTAADAPPPSTFPLTRAARVALWFNKHGGRVA